MAKKKPIVEKKPTGGAIPPGNMFESWVVVIDSMEQGPHVLFNASSEVLAMEVAAEYLLDKTIPLVRSNLRMTQAFVKQLDRVERFCQRRRSPNASAQAIEAWREIRPEGFPDYLIFHTVLNRFVAEKPERVEGY